MFPKNVGEFTYADLKSARKFPWFPQLREQLLPSRFRDFEKFLASAGVDPNTQVDEIAWAGISATKTSGEEVVGVALGSFDPSSSEDRFKQQKLPMIEVHGYHLYAFGSGAGANDILFMFIDSNTAAFGHRPALEQLIDVRTGVSESLLTNDLIFGLIGEANGNGIIWGVLDKTYAHLAMTQLLPEASQFAQASPIINRIRAMTISVDAGSGIDAHFQAVCNSPDDANLAFGGNAGRADDAPLPGSAGPSRPRRRARSGSRGTGRRPAEDRSSCDAGPASFADQDTRVCVADVGISLNSCSE